MDAALQALLAELEEQGSKNDALESEYSSRMMNLEPATARVLALWVCSARRQRVLEIGTSNGYSTLWLAWAVSVAGGQVTSVDRLAEKHELADTNLRRAGLREYVELATGDATAIVAGLPGPFDCVFFDADRFSIPGQLELLLPKLTPDVLLFSDNATSHPQELAGYFAALDALPDFEQTVVPVGKGLSVAYRSGGAQQGAAMTHEPSIDDAPILEFDAAPEAILEPKRILKPMDIPEHAVLCFFQDVITQLSQAHEMRVVKHLRSEMGTHPIWEMTVEGQRLAVFHPGVGAPLAAALLEEVIALGCRKFIACGGAGVLDSTIALGHVLVPVAAVRDEGTSYHYLPPAREVEASAEGVAAIEATLTAHGVEYLLTKTWTTDAIYRETPEKMRRRKDEGCLAVEMEAAAFFAVARFREVTFAQMLYGGDDLAGERWDAREWHAHSGREKLFWLAAEACLQL